MSCTQFSKFLSIVVFVLTVSVAASDIGSDWGVARDGLDSDEDTIGGGDSKFAYMNQPEFDNSKSYPSNLRFLFGKSREWSNFQHPKQLKRSGDLTSSSLQFSSEINNDSRDTFMNNSLPKYHCPINLLHGNNLTVKNYFLVMPRSNDNFNDTLQRIALLGEENCEPKTIKPHEQLTSSKTMLEGEQLLPNHSVSSVHPSVLTTAQPFFDKPEETSTKNNGEGLLSEHATVVLYNTSEAEPSSTTSSVKEESSLSLFGEEDKTSTTPIVVEAAAPTTSSGLISEAHTNTPLPASSSEISEFLRTVDKYCETYNTHTSPPSPANAMVPTALYNNFIPPVEQMRRLNRNLNLKTRQQSVNQSKNKQ